MNHFHISAYSTLVRCVKRWPEAFRSQWPWKEKIIVYSYGTSSRSKLTFIFIQVAFIDQVRSLFLSLPSPFSSFHRSVSISWIASRAMEGHRRAESSADNGRRKFSDDDQGKAADAQGFLANGRPRAATAANANARLAQMMMRVKPAAEYDEEEPDLIPSIVGGGSSFRNGSPRLASFRGYGGGASPLARNPSSLVIYLVNSSCWFIYIFNTKIVRRKKEQYIY